MGRLQQIINYTQTWRDLCAGFNKHLISIEFVYLLSLLQQNELWFPPSCTAGVDGNKTAVSATVVL